MTTLSRQAGIAWRKWQIAMLDRRIVRLDARIAAATLAHLAAEREDDGT